MICPACDHDNIQGVDVCDNCGTDLAGLDVPLTGIGEDDPMLKKPVGELGLKQPLTLPVGATVAEAIEKMRAAGEGCVFALDPERRLAGVFTERDVATRVAARGRDPRTTPLEKVMTPGPLSLLRDDPFAWALYRMGVEGHRHLPVLEEGRLIGFLSSRTVLRALLDD